jgi:CheY-like chemotaxis protein/HPt (histidine-containing phosphotransfer) domain-containing protein
MREKRSLLLIDDDETTRMLLQLLLTGEGWDVQSEASGDAAAKTLANATALPDVILSDLQMPGLSGSAMANAMRSTMAKQAEPEAMPLLFAMTATDRDGPPSGFDDLLVKPFPPAELLKRCESHWTHTAGPGETPIVAGEAVLARDVFDQLKQSMPATQLHALYDFALTDAEGRVTRMAAAIQARDDAGFRREAHALKGSCGMVGALRLRSLASDAEDGGYQARTLIESNPLARFHEEIGRIRHMLESLLQA